MNVDTGDLVVTTATIALPLLAVGLVLATWRLWKGPSVADRVVALELIVSLMVGIIATLSIAVDQPAYLDAAIALTLVAFLGAIGFSAYIQRSASR
jgi:multicomponent Na+:H+ antiporter subunit F